MSDRDAAGRVEGERVFCPFCESRDHRQLQNLFVEGQDQKYRVMACDAGHGFVRGISTLTLLTTPGLLVAELETLHPEMIARERGYANEVNDRPTSAAC